MAKEKNHYIDNKKFYQALVDYKVIHDREIAAGNDRPKIPNYIGECFYYIAERYSRHKNFRNYYYRDEMISEGVFNCTKYIHKFDPTKYNNPFAYFTQIIFNAFIYKINKEKRYLYTKFKLLEKHEIFDSMSDKQEHDDTDFGESTFYSQEAFNKRLEFVEDYEIKNEEKKVRAARKTTNKKVKETLDIDEKSSNSN